MSHPLKNPAAGKRVKVNLTIDPDVYPAAREKSQKDSVSVSEAITRLLRGWVSGKFDITKP